MVSIAKGGEKGDFRCAKYDKMSVRVIDCLGYGAGGFEEGPEAHGFYVLCRATGVFDERIYVILWRADLCLLGL